MRPSLSDEATRLLGTPFRWRARGPDALDCVGLMLHIYRVCYGVELPDPIGPGSSERIHALRSHFDQVEIEDAREGDLLHLVNPDRVSDQHVAIVESHARIICTNSVGGVQRAPLADLKRPGHEFRIYRLRQP